MTRTLVTCATTVLVGCTAEILAAEPSLASAGAPQSGVASASDLSFDNLLTAGWDEPWSRRPHPDGAPDLTLLRVQTNLLLDSLRTDYYYERTTPAGAEGHIHYVSQLLEYSLDRRLMLAAFGAYQSETGRFETGRDGGAYGGLIRLQLVDTPHASYALNVKATAPNGGVGQEQTVTSWALAGWHDLARAGLGKVGIYWHVQEETALGPAAPASQRNDLTYDLTLAKTWSSPTAPIGQFSTFLETYAKTALDGSKRGQSTATLTPGFRFNLFRHHVFMFGFDVPVVEPRPFDQLYRFTYIYSF